MVIDEYAELAAPDLELARLLLRSGKPVFLAVNKIDTAALAPSAENFRRLGFANVIPISAEHGAGIGDLLDQVFAALPSTEPGAPNAESSTESDALSKLRLGGIENPELGAPSRSAGPQGAKVGTKNSAVIPSTEPGAPSKLRLGGD